MPSGPERGRAGAPHGRPDGSHGRPSARRSHTRLIRRLGREHLRPGPARRVPLPNGPARGAPLVPRPRHGHHQVRRLRRARGTLDRARGPGARPRATGRTAVRSAAADSGPQLRPRRARAADRPIGSQDRPRSDGSVRAVHYPQRQGLAGPRRPAGDLPLPRAQRLQRPHVSARAAGRRRSGTRADHADRHGPRTPPHPGPRAGGRALARVGRARRSARRLLRPRAGERADSPQHRRRTVRRLLLPGRRRRECRRPRKPAPVSAGAALPSRGRSEGPPPDRASL